MSTMKSLHPVHRDHRAIVLIVNRCRRRVQRYRTPSSRSISS